MRKIVIGYDGSDSARRALERAAEFVDGGSITVVSAVHRLGGKSGPGTIRSSRRITSAT